MSAKENLNPSSNGDQKSPLRSTSIIDLEITKFFKRYDGSLERKYAELEQAEPLHSESGELGYFVKFVNGHPLNRTEHGIEFYINPKASIPSEE